MINVKHLYTIITTAVLLFAMQPSCFAEGKTTQLNEDKKKESLTTIDLAQEDKTKRKKKIKLLNADIGTPATVNGKKVTRLIGNVKLSHEDVIMTCDSAYLNDKESFLEAFSNVKIVQEDLTIKSKTLTYSGHDKVARLRTDISMHKEDKTLYTDFLDYNINTKIGYYYKGGKLISTENNNTLTSKRGFYFDEKETVLFLDTVNLVNPDYTIDSDSLEYHTQTEKVRLLGKSVIVNQDNTLYSQSGWYDTKAETCYFNKRAKIVTPEQILESDSLYYDQIAGLGKAYYNVIISDTVNNFGITGNEAIYNEKTKRLVVTNKLLLQQVDGNDTLFIAADSLKSFTSNIDSTKRIFQLYNHVKFFREDMQGTCDSLIYSEQDSAFYMFNSPILWSEESQLTGDTIHLYLKNKQIDRLFIPSSALIISEEDSTAYNQIKGKKLEGFFVNNKMNRMEIIGNGQTIYYAYEETKNDTTDIVQKDLIGVNKAECSNILVTFNTEGKMNSVGFLIKPHTEMHRIEELKKEDLFFKEFKWEIERRPESKKSLHRQD